MLETVGKNPKGKGKSNQGGSHSKGKGDSKGKGKGSKGTKAQGKGKGQNKSGKNHAMEGDEPEGEQFAEGEEWADYQAQEGDWPATEATYEEPGEQGAIWHEHEPRLQVGQQRSCRKILKQVNFGKGRRTFGICRGSWFAKRATRKPHLSVDTKVAGGITRSSPHLFPTSNTFGQR